ncbi:type II toxin-antitoxin system RelE/ParE family toxin [Rhodobacter capsulatus]|uniref:type II toxin-antitoxin system RelE/ParE family toxin n=1 Tax=Rhodobacter capsulatus TaxID=1061 RepID=UPI0003D3236F|nr:type II toxin-antitoxin system RelE/ParE family toxin [Rhodobacter capsulatus]ETD85431.1 plasmid stabilization protein [Rhodobacter capsulatus YW1]
MAVSIQETASPRLDEIFCYTRDRLGVDEADRYITDLFAAFDRIEGSGVASRPVPAEFGVDGFYFRHAHHVVYWRRLANGDVGIVTILHERMHQMDRFWDDRGG